MSFQTTATEEDLAQAGIYCIKNTINGNTYVGSSIHIKRRMRNHLEGLKKGKHHSAYLQNSYAKHGLGVFSFYILEFVNDTTTVLLEREQFWIDFLQPEYNMSKKVSRYPDKVFQQNIYVIIAPDLTQYEAREGLFKFAKIHGLSESALAVCARGEYPHHKKWQCFLKSEFDPAKIKDPSTFRATGETVYRVTKPDDTEELTNNLYEYARDHDLDGSSFCKVFNGKLNHHKQYKVREDGTPPREISRKKQVIPATATQHFILTSPTGVQYTTTNIAAFALTHEVSKDSLREVARGKLRQHKGWLCSYTPETFATLTTEVQTKITDRLAMHVLHPDRKPMSTEDRQRITDSSRTPEAIEKRVASLTGKKRSADSVQNISLSHCKTEYLVTTPDGLQVLTKQLVQYAKENNLTYSSLRKIYLKGGTYKGYTVQ